MGEEQEIQTIPTTVMIVSKEGTFEEEKNIVLGGKENQEKKEVFGEETREHQLNREVDSIIGNLENFSEGEKILLPSSLEDGTPIFWKEKKQNPMIVIGIGFFLVLILLYFSRFDDLKKKEKKARESIIQELPEFINKLVLLLNGGMIVHNALGKIVFDYKKTRQSQNNYFYEQMAQVMERVEKTNTPLRHELTKFAKRSQVHQLIRVVNTISDNLEKGVQLSQKLQRENEALWYARKKQSEEKGRIAESKLTIPLMILLLVLVMITIAPAMLTM